MQDFFDNIEKWQEKHSVLNDSGNFLIEMSEEPIAAEIKQQLLLINRRWKDVSEQAKAFMQQETSERSRREYRLGVDQLREWLDRTEGVIASPVDCDLQAVRAHVKLLDVRYNVDYFRGAAFNCLFSKQRF